MPNNRSSDICDLCQGIFDSWGEWLEHDHHYFAHHKSVAGLEEASKSRCSLCDQFWRAWLSNNPHSSSARKRVAGLKKQACKGLGVHIQKKHCGLPPNLESFYCLSLDFGIFDAKASFQGIQALIDIVRLDVSAYGTKGQYPRLLHWNRTKLPASI